MKCPIDTDTELAMSDRQGIEIDYCPKCRGVWLDRGELDKLIERSAAPRSPSPVERERHYRDDDERYGHKRRKKGFLGEIFDFD
jgi:uncharacterized protein